MLLSILHLHCGFVLIVIVFEFVWIVDTLYSLAFVCVNFVCLFVFHLMFEHFRDCELC